MPESPAERAGLHEGDMILEIDGDDRQNIQVYQNLLRTIGPKVKILVKRTNGETAKVEVKIDSIL
jgi:C-terminal processing protease CtpA/Prc